MYNFEGLDYNRLMADFTEWRSWLRREHGENSWVAWYNDSNQIYAGRSTPHLVLRSGINFVIPSFILFKYYDFFLGSYKVAGLPPIPVNLISLLALGMSRHCQH